MNRNRWSFLSILGIALAGVALWAAVGSALEPAEENVSKEVRVRVAPVESGSVGATFLRWGGIVRAADRAMLSFPVGARLAERKVEIGDRVERGQVLARLDTRQLDNGRAVAAASRLEAEAALAQAERDEARVRQLAGRKAATPQELEQVQTAVEARRAALAAAEAGEQEAARRLVDGTLRAPFDGSITGVLADAGETLSPGDPVYEISGEGSVEVEVKLPEAVLSGVREGAAVRVLVPLAGDADVAGTVRRVGRAGTSEGLFPVLIDVAGEVGGPRLLPGVGVEVELPGPTRSEVTVPLAAVLNPGANEPHVFRVENGRVVRVVVDVLSLLGERVAVRGELAPGDSVVVTGHTSLLNGDAVETEL